MPEVVHLSEGLSRIRQRSHLTLLAKAAQLFNEAIQVRRDYAKQNSARLWLVVGLGWRAAQFDVDANVTSRVAAVESASDLTVAGQIGLAKHKLPLVLA